MLNCMLVGMAESEGFEPSIAFRLCQFSRLVPSTTRPTLRLIVLLPMVTASPWLWRSQFRELLSLASWQHP